MRDRGKRLILAALVLSVLAAFVWVIRLQPPAPKTIRPAKAPSSAVPKSGESAPAAPADAAVGAPPPASARPPAPPAPSAPVAATPTAASRDQTLADFRSWTAEAIKAGSKSGDFLARGEALARQRREVMEQLIIEDPERAIAMAVSPLMRQQLPPAIVNQLEERISTRGDFSVLATLPPAGGAAVLPAVLRLLVTPDGKTYNAYVFGKRV